MSFFGVKRTTGPGFYTEKRPVVACCCCRLVAVVNDNTKLVASNIVGGGEQRGIIRGEEPLGDAGRASSSKISVAAVLGWCQAVWRAVTR